MSHEYRAFGLSIASELEIPELWRVDGGLPAGTAAEVTIGVDALPDDIDAPLRCADGYDVGRRHIVLRVPGVARFLAEDGTRLTVEPASGADARAVRLYVKGSGLAAILHQRGAFPLHASAVAHEGGCIAFLGDSGAGKSTLAVMLAQRGFPLVSDDVVLTRRSAGGAILAEASLPALKLWPEAMAATGLHAAAAPFEAGELRKHHVVVREKFTQEALPLRRLYLLRWLHPSSAAPQITPIAPFDAMIGLRPNVYRPSLIEAMGREAQFVDYGAALVAGAGAFTFDRGCDLEGARSQIDVLEDHIRSC